MWKLLPLLNSKLCKFSDSKSIHFTNIPSPWKLGAETQNQEEAGKRDESVKVYILILKCIFWFKILTAIFRSVVWNEIRIGDKKTGLRRILPRFIDWILWHQPILIVLSQEPNHQDQYQEDRDTEEPSKSFHQGFYRLSLWWLPLLMCHV